MVVRFLLVQVELKTEFKNKEEFDDKFDFMLNKIKAITKEMKLS